MVASRNSSLPRSIRVYLRRVLPASVALVCETGRGIKATSEREARPPMTSRSVQESSGSSWERRPYDLTELIDSASASGGSGRPGGGHGDGSGRQTPPGAA